MKTMMNRRIFLALSGMTGAAALGRTEAAADAASSSDRDYYELRRYQIDSSEQAEAFGQFAQQAAIPALNRIGIAPVGVFQPREGISPIYVLLRHPTLQSVATVTERLADDELFLSAGASFLDAPASDPAYVRMESSLMVAFQGMPRLQTPVTAPGRVVQLRTYESSSVKAGQKKIEMFNREEIDIFRKTGLHAVFFGETLVGDKMPNLTYMLAFEDEEEQKANWKRFIADPDWERLKTMPEYADRKIVSNITNLLLKPTKYSQI